MMLVLEYISVFITSFLLIKIIIRNAHKLGLVDIPNDRSSHCNIIPRGAGIGFITSILLFFIVFETDLLLEYKFVFIAIFLVLIVGILDDHKDAPPKAKFVVIFLSTYLLYINGITIPSLGSYFGFDIRLGFLALPFSLIAVAGFTNALNLIDGLDGLAASISTIILITFLYIGFVYRDDFIIVLSFVAIISISAFLVFNWNPARIFMGDSGSLSLGFIISLIAIKSIEYIHPVTVLFLVLIPVLDTLIVMVRRIRRGKSPFSADKTHIHHILCKFLGDNVKRTVIFLSLLQLMFCFFGYVSAKHIESYPDGILPLLLLVGFCIIFVLSYMIFTAMKRRQKLIDKLSSRYETRG